MAHLFVSDLHLDGEAPGATNQFLEFLRTQAQRAASLYILGDLFEAWVGDDDIDVERARVLAGLNALTQAGVPVFVMRGNRDFLYGAGFEARSGCRLLPDPLVMELGGVRTLVSHGDLLCTDDHKYQELRSIVRRPAWQARFLALPLVDRLLLASEARAGSQAHTSRVIPTIMDANQIAIEAAMRATRTQRLIHGHTHRPGVHHFTLDGQPATRIVLGAWYEQGSVVVVENGEVDLRTLAR